MNTRKKLMIVVLGFILLVAFGVPSPGQAQGIIHGDSVAEGETIDKNIVLNGTDVTIDGTVNGDVIAFGMNITVDGQVNGDLFVFAEKILINGQVTNNIIAAGGLIELGPEAQITRDLYFAGARLALIDGSSIKRDLYSLCLDAQISGEIGRDIQAIIGPLQIVNLFFGPLKDRISLIGAVAPVEVAQANTPHLAGIGVGLLAPSYIWQTGGSETVQQAGQIDTERLGEWGTALLRHLAALLALGLLAFWLVPMPLNWASDNIRVKPWRTALLGFVYFVGGWLAAIILLILVVMLALFFYSISLPNLGFLVGTLGILGVGLAAVVFWFSIIYLSKIVVANLISRLFLDRYAPQYTRSYLWPLLLVIVLYTLVASIPYLGWVIATLATFIGLGGIWAMNAPFLSKSPDIDAPPVAADAD